MTEERRRQIEEIVLSMLALKSAERAARLDSACGHDDDLRREVESLLAQETRAGTFLEVPALDAAARVLTDGHSDLLPGSTVGPYRIDAFLGAGGMGEVYRAWDTRLRRAVALKFLPREYLSDSAALERFQREARAASALSHPNICVVHDIGDFDGRPFIAMEYLDGQTLRAALKGAALPSRQALEYAAQIADGLATAHQRGVVHRDLKPENLWITPEARVKILDFGLAKVAEPVDQAEGATVTLATKPGMVMGTVGYMSPEQLRGQSVDHRSDLFAFGVILYEMLSGRRAFAGPSAADTLSAILYQEPPELTDPGINGLVCRCLKKDPGQRIQSASEVASNVGELLAAERGSSGSLQTGLKPARRSRFRIAAIAVALAAIAALVGFTLRSRLAIPHITRLAVLPLENISNDAEQEIFADGMTEVLIADLAQIGALRVISRTSVMQFKGTKKTLPEIAKELGVDQIVTASVMKSGGRVRITAELVDGATDQHLWANAYERELSDVLTLQAEVARAIADEVRARLTPTEAGRLAHNRKVVPAALDAYMLGRYYWDRFTPESLVKSIENYEQAAKLDPEYSAAYSGMAEARGGLFEMGASSWEDTIPQAKSDVTKALALDDSSAEAHQTLGFIRYLGWDWKGAEEENQKATSLNPAYSTVYVLECNIQRHLGRAEASIAAAKRGLEADPLAMITNQMLGNAYVNARRYDLAIAQYLKALELHPKDSTLLHHLGWAYVYNGENDKGLAAMESSSELEGLDKRLDPYLAYIHAVSGDKKQARQTLSLLLELAAKEPLQPGLIALIYLGLDERAEALAWLEKAYQQHSTMMIWLKVDPRFDRIRQEPGFQDLMRRVGLI